ncbi:MAG: hypothetical protein MI919_19365 [Holophagales bacterium]|nr:hypothetical protein [Holophagales bacterium]
MNPRWKTRPACLAAPVFTRHLRALATDDRPIELDQIDEVRRALRRALERELRRRGLRHSSPALLGIPGNPVWSDGDALDELVAECYVFVFIRRLRSLLAQLELKPQVEGLVALNIRHFVFERQKAFDPLGYHTYEVVHRAVRLALDARILRRPEGAATLDNRTWLTTRIASDRDDADRGLDSEPDLCPLVAAWADELVPAVALARGRADRVAISRRLYPRFDDLGEAGIGGFRFKSLVDPLKRLVRDSWAAILDREMGNSMLDIGDQGELHRVRIATPDARFENDQTLSRLIDAVERRIVEDGEGGDRLQLLALWRLICAHVTSRSEPSRQGRAASHGFSELPSQRRISIELGVHRRRVTPLLLSLQDIVRGIAEASYR